MNQTPNYQLNQWDKGDRILMEDFNADNAKTDTALQTLASSLASLSSASSKHGNCQIYYSHYTGNGNASRTFLTPKRPVFIFLHCGPYVCFSSSGCTTANYFSTIRGSASGTATWTNSAVTISSESAQVICNVKNEPCSAVILMAVDG